MKRSPALLLVITILFLLLNSYIASGLYTVVPSPYFSITFWSVIVTCIILLLLAFQRLREKGPGPFFKIIAHLFLVLLVGELLFAAALAIEDSYRLLAGLTNLFTKHQFLAPERNSYWTYLGLTLFGATVLTFLYGMLKGKYAYRVIRHILFFDDLPEAFDGFTLTQISDVHAGSFTNPMAVQKGIDLIKAQNSDLFVFTGDLVNNKAVEIEPWIGHFSQIRAPFGQFSVLGNHDYGDYVKWQSGTEKRDNLARLKQYHAAIGFRLLLDEHVVLQKDGAQLVLAGIENWGIGFGERGDLERALHGTSANHFKILLSHDPSHWEAQVKDNPNKIQLTLAGHTHGMQFGIEAFGMKWSPVKWRYKHWAGIKQVAGRVLNVNRGFGFIGFSGRIGIWPEITVIELRRGKEGK